MKVFDNGGITLDRYTVCCVDGMALGLSADPDSPQGFSTWGEVSPDADTTLLGEEIKFEDLPENVQEHIKKRQEDHALRLLEEMPEEEFQKFFKSLPYRTRLCCQGGLVDWKEVLPQWYIKQEGESWR